MQQYALMKKTALAAAIICATTSLSVQAVENNESNNAKIAATFALGTQSQATAEAQESAKTEDDTKLSPNLFRLKEYVKQEKNTQQSRTSRSKRAVDDSVDINLDLLINGSIDSVQGELDAVGFSVKAVYGNSVGGTISADNLEALSQISAVKRINMPVRKRRAGAVENQADFVQYSKKVKETLKNAPTGKGVTIGILSDSFDCASVTNEPGAITAAEDVRNGELPGDIYVVKEEADCFHTGTDEGRAMAQLVHDIAPDAKIAFYSPKTQTDFARGIQILAQPKGQSENNGPEGAGADIIVDDLGFPDEPIYEVGIIGDSITSVAKKGVAYFTAGGNDNLLDDSGTRNTSVYTTSSAEFVPFTPVQNSPTQLNNAQVMKVGKQSNSTVIPIEVSNSHEEQNIGIWWAQSYAKGNKSRIMACLTNADGTAINNNSWCETQPLGQNPMLVLSFALPQNLSGGKYGLQVFYLGGVKPTSFTMLGHGSVKFDPSVATNNGSLYGHTNVAEAFTLGAVDFAETPQCDSQFSEPKIESFSSHGNSPLLFDSQGNAINIIPNKPDATAIDGVSTSFFGTFDRFAALRTYKDSSCNLTSDYRFYGTSAAAPNAAAVAALIKQDNPGIAPEELYKVMRQTATPIGKAPTDGNYNYVSGYGLINAEKAVNTLRASGSK